MNYKDMRYHLYLMKEHIGNVLDGEAELDLNGLWSWMDQVLHSDKEE